MKIVGRRVKIVDREDATGDVIGKTGVILKEIVDGDTIYYLVKVNGWDNGHTGDENEGPHNKWYFNRTAFKFAPSRKRRKK